jgi:hypothetical protein
LIHEKDNEYHKSYDLTKEEAKQLANRLLTAASVADAMDESVEDYFQQEEIQQLNDEKLQ